MTPHAKRNSAFTTTLFILLILLLIARFAILGSYPLFGTTEPRYAELARKMFVTGDWVTLWVADNVPLWGKPPLLFWLDTLAMHVLGMTEFALRLPTYIASLLVLSLFWFWPFSAGNKKQFTLIASLVYFSTPLGFLAAGFVATDIFLTLGLALSMVSFWRVLITDVNDLNNQSSATIWSWLFFVGIAIGLLAKGPLSLVLLGIALLLWAAFAPVVRIRLIWKRLPWWRGLALMALIAFPWYIMAEIRTPGFLNHFIIGEHIQRFLVKDWGGGRFAPSHGEPLGMIWWFAVESFMPWILLSIPALVFVYAKKQPQTIKPTHTPNLQKTNTEPSELLYLLCWILASLLFFSLSHNILEAYVLPTLPAFAILMSHLIRYLIKRSPKWQWCMLATLLTPAIVVTIALFFRPILTTQSQQHLLKNWQFGTALVYVGGVPPSGVFYSHNQAKQVASFADVETIDRQKISDSPTTVIMHKTVFESLSLKQKSEWPLVEAYSEYVMLRKSSP